MLDVFDLPEYVGEIAVTDGIRLVVDQSKRHLYALLSSKLAKKYPNAQVYLKFSKSDQHFIELRPTSDSTVFSLEENKITGFSDLIVCVKPA